MSLSDLTIPAKIKVKHIEKKYYKKFFYKICFKINSKIITNSNYDRHDYSRSMSIRRAVLKLLDKIQLVSGDIECRVRTEYTTLSLFLNDESAIQKLLTDFEKDIYEIHCPFTETHKEVVDESRRIRVRKKLFENKFKFKVYISQSWKLREDRYSDFKAWTDTLEDADGTRYGVNNTLAKYFDINRKNYKNLGYTAAIYLNDPEDLMMMQMKFHDQIYYIEEAVLLSDL